MMGAGARLVDVRTPVEYAEFHAVGAELHPLQQISGDAAKALCLRAEKQPLLLICKSGKRAHEAATRLQVLLAGTDLYVVEGGSDAWRQAGLPVEKTQVKIMSLERQTRLVIGVLVILFSCLSLLVHPWFTWGALLMGAGLAFAAITNTCALGMLIARMPWNRGAS